MQSAAFAVRLLSGPAEAVRVALASCQAGARKEAYQDARRRAGIIREAVWIRPAPGGHVAVVYLEADGLEKEAGAADHEATDARQRHGGGQ